jgi:threonine dehydrogenase-like Zn-dependent dehydrogenase
VALIAQGAIDVERVVTDVVPIGEAAPAIARLRAGDGLKVLVKGPAAA